MRRCWRFPFTLWIKINSFKYHLSFWHFSLLHSIMLDNILQPRRKNFAIWFFHTNIILLIIVILIKKVFISFLFRRIGGWRDARQLNCMIRIDILLIWRLAKLDCTFFRSLFEATLLFLTSFFIIFLRMYILLILFCI